MSHVVCLMNVEADRATFTWSEGPAAFEPYTLDGLVYKEFKEIAETAREKLANLIKDYLYGEENVAQATYELAEAGYELYEALFDPGADQKRQARQVRKWLEKLALQHEVDTLEMVVESPWSLPWNVLYDQEPDKDEFLENDDSPDRWRPFWGLRYNLAGGRKVDPLRRMPILKNPCVLMVVDPTIRDGLPVEQQRRLATFADEHGLKVVNTKDELKAAIKAERPDLLYWMSHADPEALVLSGEPVSPRNLRRLLKDDDDEDLGCGGLAFLNACRTVESTGEEGSFFEAFHSVGFAGMIGTEHQTIDQFANPLGLDFLEAFLDEGKPVGSVLRRLRGRVPLGLLYGTYCPPDIRVDSRGIGDSVEITQAARGGGTVLGSALAEQIAAVATAPPLPQDPYRSLAYYDRQDRALFAGRDNDIERFATMLDDAATRILVLHGESGVGKSSFLRAGVIPYLEEECLGYRFIRDRKEISGGQAQGAVLFVRATNDLFGQLAQVICDFCARPYEYQTPLGESVSADLRSVVGELVGDKVTPGTVRAVLRVDPTMLGRILAAVSDQLPFSAILVIDQGEEVFTLAESPDDFERGREALGMLRRTVSASGGFKVIFSLRTEYYGRLIDRLRRGLHDTGNIREYLLTDFEEDGVIEAIRRPTADEPIPYTSDIPFEKYGFRYAEGVDEEIAHRVIRYTTQRRDSVLPLVQVICAQLYRLAATRADHTITLVDLETLGGIEGGMRKHVEGLLGVLLQGRPLDKKPLQKLFTQLYLKQPDGTLTTALLPEDEVRRRWTGRMPFDELLSSALAVRLLKVNNLRIGMNEERRYVSLGHDALARIAADWDEALGRGARIRKMLAATAAAVALAVVMGVLWIRAEGAKKEALQAENEALQAKSEALAAKDEVEQQADRAERNLLTAVDAARESLQALSDNPRLKREGLFDLRNDLLQNACLKYEQLLEFNKDKPEVKFDLGRGYLRLAQIRAEIGDFEKACEDAQQAKAVFSDLARNLPPASGAKVQCLLRQAELDNAFGLIHAAQDDVIAALDNYDDALDGYEKYMKYRAVATFSEADYLDGSATVLSNQALLYCDPKHGLDYWADADDAFQQALERRRRLDELDVGPELRIKLAELYQNYGFFKHTRNELTEAEPLYLAAVHTVGQLAGEDFFGDRLVAVTTYNLADLYDRSGVPAAADRSFPAALALFERLIARYGDLPSLRLFRANTHLRLGRRAERQQREAPIDVSKIAAHYLTAIEIVRPDCRLREQRRLSFECCDRLAQLRTESLLDTAKQREVEQRYRQLIEVQSPAGGDDALMAASYGVVGVFLLRKSWYEVDSDKRATALDESEQLLTRSLATWDATREKADELEYLWQHVAATRWLGQLFQARNDSDHAKRTYRQGIARLEEFASQSDLPLKNHPTFSFLGLRLCYDLQIAGDVEFAVGRADQLSQDANLGIRAACLRSRLFARAADRDGERSDELLGRALDDLASVADQLADRPDGAAIADEKEYVQWQDLETDFQPFQDQSAVQERIKTVRTLAPRVIRLARPPLPPLPD